VGLAELLLDLEDGVDPLGGEDTYAVALEEEKGVEPIVTTTSLSSPLQSTIVASLTTLNQAGTCRIAAAVDLAQTRAERCRLHSQ
jgi:hypothetical protein